MAKKTPNGIKHSDKFYIYRDNDGDLENWGETAGVCLRNVFSSGDIDEDDEPIEIAEYTLTSVKKYKLKYDAEEA